MAESAAAANHALGNPRSELGTGRVAELIRIIHTASSDQAHASEDPLVRNLLLGQRLLFATIPFAERLAENGPARRQALLQLIGQAREEIAAVQDAPPTLLLALEALRIALEAGFETAIVASFKETSMERRLAAYRPCLRALIGMLLRWATPATPAP
jgi:hypothetical protein